MLKKCWLVIFLTLFACHANKQPITPTVPTTAGHGPGGQAILAGRVPEGVTILMYPSLDYSKELANLTVASGSDSFAITDLPLDTVDIITKGSHYFASKKCFVVLKKGVNIFSPALGDTANLDSHHRPRWVSDIVLVEFKDTTTDSIEANIILKSYYCVVVGVLDMTIFPDWFLVDIPDDKTVPEMIETLTLDKRVHYVQPNYLAYLP